MTACCFTQCSIFRLKTNTRRIDKPKLQFLPKTTIGCLPCVLWRADVYCYCCSLSLTSPTALGSSVPCYSHPAWLINDVPAAAVAASDGVGGGDWEHVAGYCAMCATTMMLWTAVIIFVAAGAFVRVFG